MRKIAAYLVNPTVSEWTLTHAQGDAWIQRLKSAGTDAELVVCSSEKEFTEVLCDVEIALTWTFRQEWFEKSQKLRHLCTPAAGKEYFGGLRPPPGVELHFGHFHGAIMGETLVGMMLGMAHGLFQNLSAMKGAGAEGWPRERFTGVARTLAGSHVVIVGFGNIGQRAGAMIKAFQTRLTGVRRHPDAVSRPSWFGPEDKVVGMDGLDAALAEADHVALVLPGDTSTDRIFDSERLRAIRRGAVLYNFGRGNSVDETALAESLRSGHLAGAVLDVFATEPLPADSPLRSLPNAFLFPHASAIAPTYLDLWLDEVGGFLPPR